MLPGSGTALVRAATVVPAILLVLFAGLFGLLGMVVGRERRSYAASLSEQAISGAYQLVHGPSRQTSGASGEARLDSASREHDAAIGRDGATAASRDAGNTSGSDHTGRVRVRQEPGTTETGAARHRRRSRSRPGLGARADEQMGGGKTAGQSATK
jgi:hypothetical protein